MLDLAAMLGCIFGPEVEKMQSDSGNESVWSDRNVCLRIDRRTILICDKNAKKYFDFCIEYCII